MLRVVPHDRALVDELRAAGADRLCGHWLNGSSWVGDHPVTGLVSRDVWRVQHMGSASTRRVESDADGVLPSVLLLSLIHI